MMAADEPTPVVMTTESEGADGGARPSEGSGDDDEPVGTLSQAIAQTAKRAKPVDEGERKGEDGPDEDEDIQPASMLAMAESLILFHPAVNQAEASRESSVSPVKRTEDVAGGSEDDGNRGSIPLPFISSSSSSDGPEPGKSGVFTYLDHVIEIVQLDPPLPLPSPPPVLLLLLELNKTGGAADADVEEHVRADGLSHPSGRELPTAKEQVLLLPPDSHSTHEETSRPLPPPTLPSSTEGRSRHDVGNVTSNDTLPPDPDDVVDIVDADVIIGGHVPDYDTTEAISLGTASPDWFSLAGNISEDILSPHWPDVISYRGPPVPPAGPCECSCPTTSTVPTIILPTCPTLPTETTTTPTTTTSTSPSTTTTTARTTTSTTQLIPPILILEGKC